MSKSFIAPFDQTTVFSQASINARLRELHAAHPILQKINIRQDDDEDMGLVDCILDPPNVHLATGPNRESVTYFVNIKVWGALKADGL